ncbi:hypothetical protein BCR44DRAFT_1432474, partial [Catenaria anguillulae PL171]
ERMLHWLLERELEPDSRLVHTYRYSSAADPLEATISHASSPTPTVYQLGHVVHSTARPLVKSRTRPRTHRLSQPRPNTCPITRSRRLWHNKATLADLFPCSWPSSNPTHLCFQHPWTCFPRIAGTGRFTRELHSYSRRHCLLPTGTPCSGRTHPYVLCAHMSLARFRPMAGFLLTQLEISSHWT